MRSLIGAIVLALLASMLPARSEAGITLDVHDARLADVIALLAAQSGRNVVADDSVKPERVTLHLRNVTFDEALTTLVETHDLQVRDEHGILIVGSAEATNKRYGNPNDPRSPKTVVLRLRHAAAEEVAKEIADGLPDGTLVLADKRTASLIVTGNSDAILRARELVAALDAPVAQTGDATHVYRLRYVKPSEISANLKGALPDGSFVADDALNAVVISGDADTQRAAGRFIDSMDVPSAQVLFEVRVADLQPVNEQSDVGLEFGGYDLGGQPIPGAATYAFTRNAISVNARLNALVSQGRAEILATPKLVTLNNREADLLIGQTYPVVYYDAHFGGQQVQFVDVGVKLRLTPQIGADGSVTAELHPEYSAIQGFVSGYPVIANRKIDSTLRVKSDQTIVLGGLLREIDAQTVTKVPFLADIPVFGKIFQDRQRTRERDEIVFLITPHVIPPNAPPPTK
jgi:type IV pilus assembly protein PilQ